MRIGTIFNSPWAPRPFDPTDYINFDVDIKVDVANSSLSADGWSYGAVELIINNPWTTVVGWVNLAPTAEWQHLSGSFSGIPSGTYSDAIIGFISDGSSSLTGPVSVWIDNIVFTAPPTVFTNRPTLSLAKAPAGGSDLHLQQAARHLAAPDGPNGQQQLFLEYGAAVSQRLIP